MKKVKSLKYNWHQDVAGQAWERFTVGENGVESIIENAPHNGMELWNYEVVLENGTSYRIFNPNFVEYSNK